LLQFFQAFFSVWISWKFENRQKINDKNENYSVIQGLLSNFDLDNYFPTLVLSIFQGLPLFSLFFNYSSSLFFSETAVPSISILYLLLMRLLFPPKVR